MSSKRHADFQEEDQRLQETKEYIDFVMKTSAQNMDSYSDNIKQAYEELDYLDSSQSYINILTNSKFMEMIQRDVTNLERVRNKPYFCRIDFRSKKSQEAEKLYIGKTSLYRRDDHRPLIIDWRSPIANVYYEGRIGEVTYQTHSGTAKGELFRKRQYNIDSGELIDFRDIDITTRDELLQSSLASTADHRLKDIVSTIQAEQNRIIRAEMNRPLIVQGVAGSGKTTIALHRIAYFIYTYAKTFDPDQFMILAPNRLFIHYIADVLPELGVEKVKQTTFTDFVAECIGGKKYKLHPDDKLIRFIEQKDEESTLNLMKWSSYFKGSMAYKNIVDRYVKELQQSILPKKDFKLGKFVVYSHEEIRRLFFVDYAYMPVYKRIESIKKILSNHLRTKKKEILKEIEEAYDNKIDLCFIKMKDLEKRRTKVVHLMDKKEETLQKFEKKARTLVKDYMSELSKPDLFDYYLQLFEDKERMNRYTKGTIEEGKIRYLCQTTQEILKNKKYEMEDMAALLYLKHLLFGLDDNIKIKNVVVDEAQDFSAFQFYALKTALNTDLFTILGDLSQGIHSYRGITDWQDLISEVFPDKNAQYMTLQQSYRTTIEIMSLANAVICQSKSKGIVLAEPVVRHGMKPRIQYIAEEDQLISSIQVQIQEIRNDGHQSIAIIGKSKEECKRIQKRLAKESSLPIKLLHGEEEMDKNEILIVPAHIAKGLEFDAVMIVTLEDTFSSSNELDIKLLYVAMTRPLHRLSFIAKKRTLPILDHVPSDLMAK